MKILRLGLPDDRAAELVAEIAAHINSVGGNPVEEFGRPSIFARELIAAEAPRNPLARRLTIGALSAVAMAVGMIGYTLLLRGTSPLELRSLGQPTMMGVVIGGLSPIVRGPIRDGEGPWPILIYFGSMLPLAFAGAHLIGRIDPAATITIPFVRWVGAVVMIAGLAAAWFVRRPLQFRDDAPVTSTFWGKVRRV